jgi:hypothetical protein
MGIYHGQWRDEILCFIMHDFSYSMYSVVVVVFSLSLVTRLFSLVLVPLKKG